MTAQEQKQFLGENLYTRIISIDPLFQDMDLAGKITGMLLEMDNTDLLHLLESQDALRDKAQEAIDVLGAHEQQKSAATPNSTAKFCAVVRNHPALQGMQVVSYVYFTLHLTYVCLTIAGVPTPPTTSAAHHRGRPPQGRSCFCPL